MTNFAYKLTDRQFTDREKTNSLAVIKEVDRGVVQIGGQKIRVEDLNPTIRRFNQFWESMQVIDNHGFIRAAISVVGKSTVGAWWYLAKHEEARSDPPDLQRRKLMDFYNFKNKDWTNIKDYQNFANKLMIGVMYLRYFGQAAFQVVRDENGRAVGLDHLPGMIIPNVDATGNFKKGNDEGKPEPAFVQFPSSDPQVQVHFSDPRSIVYLTNPDFGGSPLGASDLTSITELTLPLDLYLMTAAREYMKNRDRPEVVYMLSEDISDEGFDQFVDEIQAKQSGAANTGKSAIAVQGEFDVKELRPLPDGLPFQESRKQAMEEELAVAGVTGAKLGLTDSLSSANLRESRREFHETSMEPLFRMIEMAFYEQIHIREFDIDGWEFKFNEPDFLTQVEKATVHMRYYGIGALNPNEIRHEMGKEERTDGDLFIDELEAQQQENAKTDPPGGDHEDEPDSPANTGEPTNDDQDPPRGDNHDDTTSDSALVSSVLEELKTWRVFSQNRIKKGRVIRAFEPHVLPKEVADLINYELKDATSKEEVDYIFDSALGTVAEIWAN